jgi:hypothetical protein
MTHTAKISTGLGSLLSAALAVSLLLAGGRAAQAGPVLTIQEGLGKVAKNINQLLGEQKKEKKVSVGQFTGPPTKFTSAGPGLAQLLVEELRRVGVRVETPADIGIEGRYRAVHVTDTNELAVQVFINVVDGEGKSILKEEYQFGILGEKEVAGTLGLTAYLPPKKGRDERNTRLENAYTNPDVSIKGTHVAAAARSPYHVEILVGPEADGDDFTPREPDPRKGQAFVPIKRGEYYRIRLYNYSGYEAAATVTIDGISMFAFSTVLNSKGKKYSQVIIGRKATIKGWFIDKKHSDTFVVTEYAKTAAAELKSNAPTGTITVAFAAAWPKNAPPPPDEPRRGNSKSAGDDGTGRGPRVKDNYKEVARTIGVVRATVSVRYTR